MMHVSPRGRALIKQFEGFREHAYQDVVGVWTIGYGFTRGVAPGPAKMVTVLRYRCNPMQDLLRPIGVQMTIPFEVLP